LTFSRPKKPDFSTLASAYARYRSSYGDDLFDLVAEHARRHAHSALRALDLGCGTGLSTRGFLDRGFAVTGVDVAVPMLDEARAALGDRASFYEASAERLPFADAAFGLVVCGQAFHWFVPQPAFAEIARVLERGGLMALFWKHELKDDPFERCAFDCLRELSEKDEPANISRAQTGRFDDFWAAKRAFFEHEEWRLPIRLPFTVDSFVGFHSSREIARFHLGTKRDLFLANLRERIGALAGPTGKFTVDGMQYVYVSRRR
jgi:SAM-dependent methyltransferase